MGSCARATVLCLFLIPWPEAMVCIFRTTAGYLQAGDHSSSFITAHKMTLVSLWSQLCLWCAEKPLHLIATKNCTNVQADRSAYLCNVVPAVQFLDRSYSKGLGTKESFHQRYYILIGNAPGFFTEY